MTFISSLHMDRHELKTTQQQQQQHITYAVKRRATTNSVAHAHISASRQQTTTATQCAGRGRHVQQRLAEVLWTLRQHSRPCCCLGGEACRLCAVCVTQQVAECFEETCVVGSAVPRAAQRLARRVAVLFTALFAHVAAQQTGWRRAGWRRCHTRRRDRYVCVVSNQSKTRLFSLCLSPHTTYLIQLTCAMAWFSAVIYSSQSLFTNIKTTTLRHTTNYNHTTSSDTRRRWWWWWNCFRWWKIQFCFVFNRFF